MSLAVTPVLSPVWALAAVVATSPAVTRATMASAPMTGRALDRVFRRLLAAMSRFPPEVVPVVSAGSWHTVPKDGSPPFRGPYHGWDGGRGISREPGGLGAATGPGRAPDRARGPAAHRRTWARRRHRRADREGSRYLGP